MWVEVLVILMEFLPIEGSFISQMTIYLPDLLDLVHSTVYNHPLQGSTTSDTLAIGYGVQEDPSFTKRDHGIFAQEMDCYSSANNAGIYLSSFVMTHCHHVLLDNDHKWGDHFGISGSQRDGYALPTHCYGIFLVHPTLSHNPYDAAGSSTEQISAYCFR